MVLYRYHVTDLSSSLPIQGADCILNLNGPTGVYPEEGYTDANGNVDLNSSGYSVYSWAVLASGYQLKGGMGAPSNPNNVQLIPSTVPPECIIDSDCPTGYFCQNGVCVEYAGCTVDSDCPEGYVCYNGVCIPIPPPPPSFNLVPAAEMVLGAALAALSTKI